MNFPAANTFTGPITLSRNNTRTIIYLTIGGVRQQVGRNYNGTTGASTPGTGSLGGGNYAGSITLCAGSTLTYFSSAAQTLAGAISGPGALQVASSGILTLSGANTYSGNTTVNTGSSVALDSAGSMNFVLGNTTANKLTGAGTATLSGTFYIDTSAVTTAVATWTLVDITNRTYTPGSFNVAGFTNSSGVWTKVVGPSTWTFTEADGKLTLNTLAVFTSFAYPGSVAVIDNSLFTVSLTVPYGTSYASIAPTYTLSSGTCDQPNSTVPTPDFGSANPVTYTVTDTSTDPDTVHAYAVTVTTAPAPILFGVSGAPLQTFDTAVPPVTEWSTLSVAGDSAGVTSGATMDTMMGTIAASSISTVLGSQAGSGTNAIAYRRTSDQKLGTQPTGNKATLLMAKLYNESGDTVSSVLLSYTLGVSVTPTEQINGHRLYWSKTGAAGSWTMAGDYLRTTPGSTTINCPLAPLDWANGDTLFVVWADDNGTGTEGDFTIDNVSFTPLPAAPFGLTVISGDAQATLNWEAYPSATGYKVKRAEVTGGPYTTVGTPTGNSFTDSPLVNGTPYYYVVSAITGATESGDSLEVGATPSGVDATLSTVVASPPALWADGIDSSTITVTLLNTSSTPIAGKTVSLAQTSGPGSAAITTVTGITGTDGKAIFTVTSTTVGTDVFTATDVTDSSLEIVQTATVSFADPASPLAINVDIDNTVRTGLVGPGGGLGAVWNTKSASSATNLLHASGPPTTVGYTSTNLGGPDEWGTPSLVMLQQGLRNFDTSPTNSQQLVINGLDPAKTYDLYIASANMLSGQRHNGVWSTTNTTTTPGDHPCGNTTDLNGTTWVEGNNYVVFRAVVPDGSGNITVNGHSIAVPGFDCRLPMSGFQLLESVTTGGYAAWADIHAGGQAANLDFNNDGVQNGIAYFMGATGLATNPGVVAGKVAWPHDPAATGITYKVMTSEDLAAWTDVTVDAVDAGGFLTYTLPTSTPKLFVRLEVVAP